MKSKNKSEEEKDQESNEESSKYLKNMKELPENKIDPNPTIKKVDIAPVDQKVEENYEETESYQQPKKRFSTSVIIKAYLNSFSD